MKCLQKKLCTSFWLKGYSGTSMQDLVDGLGISRSSLYDTYGDKHTLFMKALESYKATASDTMCNIINNSVSAKVAIRRLLELTTLELIDDDLRKGCSMTNVRPKLLRMMWKCNNVVCQERSANR